MRGVGKHVRWQSIVVGGMVLLLAVALTFLERAKSARVRLVSFPVAASASSQ